VPSPCADICQLDARRQGCIGCGRTLAEIGAWSRMDEAGKRAVWRRLRATHDPGKDVAP